MGPAAEGAVALRCRKYEKKLAEFGPISPVEFNGRLTGTAVFPTS
jgi:hypothetical protein